jgi:hypothetical protein
MIGFHFTSLVTMNIFFWQNSVIILLVMTDCDRLFAPKKAALGGNSKIGKFGTDSHPDLTKAFHRRDTETQRRCGLQDKRT